MRHQEDVVRKLVRVSAIRYETSSPAVKDSAAGVAGDLQFFIPLGGLVDVAKEKTRILAEIAQTEKAAMSIEGRLSSESFVQKAPPEVIDKERQRAAELKVKIDDLKRTISCLI